MTDLSTLNKTARSLILALREGLEKLEKGDESVPLYGQATGLSKGLQQKLADLQRTRADMDSIWRMQTLSSAVSKQDIWKRKVEQVSEETDALDLAFNRHLTRQRRRHAEEQDRQQLLDGRTVDGPTWRLQQDTEAASQSSIQNSKKTLEEMFQTGAGILTDMGAQRERLKAAHRKALDILNSLGLSDSLLRVIDRRQRMDKWMTYGGMVLTLCLVAFLWWWLKSGR
ncbi:hypothetical protein WJX73_006105 [Symbiochloris irregularis]|uniref:Membrin n=1 Tax=Symbiochloris irregularis TaxID=706552 RepID=A0AAW1NYZ5_9CHLO